MLVLLCRPEIGDRPRFPDFPHDLAFAAGRLRAEGHSAYVADSVATGETAQGYLNRIEDILADVVAVATSPAGLAAHWPLLAATAAQHPTVVLWPGEPDGAELFLELPGVRAVVCGEPDLGLLAAVALPERRVYPPDPTRDLDRLPLPYRDSTTYLYRWPGLPDVPQLHVRATRGPGRLRPVVQIAEELVVCRRAFPRAEMVVVTDPGLDREPEYLAALCDLLERDGRPWAIPGCDRTDGSADVGATLVVARPSGRGGEDEAPPATADPVDQNRATTRVAPTVRAVSAAAAIAAARAAHAPAPRRAWPRRLYVVGQQLEVYMCPGLVRGAREAGCDAHAVDCFANPQDVAALLDSTPDDVCLVDRGHGLSADVVRRIPARTVLYYPDILPTLHHASAHGRLRYEEFRSVAPAYDDVILHDYHALEFLLGEGYRNLRGVVILPFDPRRHRAYGLPRDLDVVFIGSPSPHRTAWVDTLRAAGIDVAWPNAWGDLFVTWLNRARIVLNLHFAETPNTELRIVEALATRSFVVSEPISEPAAFQAGEHFATATLETAADVIRHSLAHPEERERIAAQGHAYVLGRHSSRHCVEEILSLLPEPA